MLNNFFTFGFRTKNSIDKIMEIIPKEFGNVITFDLNFKVMLRSLRPKIYKNCKNLKTFLLLGLEQQLALTEYRKS
jgi:hypothetical protein